MLLAILTKFYNDENLYVLPATVGTSYNQVAFKSGKVIVALSEIIGVAVFWV
jgi:hypothetical protein